MMPPRRLPQANQYNTASCLSEVLRSLTHLAIKGRPLALTDLKDRTGALPTGLPGTPINHRFRLEVPDLAIGTGKVPQRASSLL
jgi:hypothetical protein